MYNLHKAGFDNAMQAAVAKSVSQDTWAEPETPEAEDNHLGKNSDGQMKYCCMKGNTLYQDRLYSIKKEANEAGDTEVADATDVLMQSIAKEAPSLEDNVAEKSKKIKHKARVLRDKVAIQQLNKDNAIDNKNGFWAIASMEMADSDNEIILIDGIEYNLDPANDIYIPIIPSHTYALPNAHAVEIGRIEKINKSEVDGVKCLLIYFVFALDENGEPLDPMTKSYYDRYRLCFTNTFSVGMDVIANPYKNEKGSRVYPKTKLNEVSMVAIPANEGAIGLTRSKQEEDTLTKSISELTEKLNKLEDVINTSLLKGFTKAFKPLENRLDMIEATMTVEPVVKANVPEVKKAVDENALKGEKFQELIRQLKEYKPKV